jgi:uncharacterized repeat protein (TIGR01451 family)
MPVRKTTSLIALIFCAAVITALSAEPGRTDLPGHVPQVVRRLSPVGTLPETNQLRLAIGLPLRNKAALTNLMEQLYDPASPQFHHYLTPEQFTENFGPTESDYQKVIAFARRHGLRVAGTHGDRVLLDVTGSVADIEKAFQVTLRTYQHPTEKRKFFAADAEPSVEAGVPVLDISGLNDYGILRPQNLQVMPVKNAKNISPNAGSSQYGYYCGNDFRAAYLPGVTQNGAGQTVGLLEFDGYYNSDITNYESQSGLTNYVVPLQIVALDNAATNSPGDGDIEVSLDIEVAIAMAPALAKVVVFEAPNSSAYFNDILSAMVSSNQIKQLSCSWSYSGSPSGTTDQYFQQMITQGQSFFDAAGDSDAYTGATGVPNDDPYITIVGGTTLATAGPGGSWVSETVWNSGGGVGGSGGVSTYYSIPTWQTGINMTTNLGSTTMRNIPDVALAADLVWCVYSNGVTSGYVRGTSIAAPLWAGLTALVNQQAAATGRSPVGFLNPAIYAIGKSGNYNASFNDITTGDNTWSSSPTKFFAVPGFDLCTGWGTPKSTNLFNALLLPVVTASSWTLLAESAVPTNGAVDSGETVTVGFALQNVSHESTSNLVATLLPGGGVLAPSGSQTYGVVAAGATSSQPFTFTATGTCGSNITATLQLQDGANNLGNVSFTLPLGGNSPFSDLSQNFDGVTAPALPSGWTTANVSGTGNSWTTTTGSYDTAPNSAFDSDSASSGQNALVSPVIAISSAIAQLSFRHNYSLENYFGTYYDGGVLEIQIGNGSFTDILAAGGSFLTNGYNRVITTTSDNPLGGRSAWGGSSSGWKTVTVRLPASAAGQNIRLRWNCATDSGNGGNGAVGWNVDTVTITDFVSNCLSVFTDLAASQSLATNSLQPGQNLIYTLTVTNLGPQFAANVVFTDTVPANATFVSASPGYTNSASKVVWPVGMLPVNASTNFILTLAPAAGNVFTNLVSVGTVTPETSTVNNTASLVATQVVPVPAGISVGPASQTIQCGSNIAFSVVVTGTPPLNLQWSLDGVPVTAATNTSFSITSLHSPNHTVTVTVTNLYGSATSNALVTVLDTLAPVITLNGGNPIFLELGSAFTDPGATATDLCAGVVGVIASGTVNTNAVSTNTIFYTASDGGNSATNTRTVIVRDTTPPMILWSFTNLIVAANSNCVALLTNVTGTNFILATDLSGALTITQTPTNNFPLPLGTNTIVITVADASGNTAFSTNTVVVQDQTPPVIFSQPQSQTNFIGTTATFSVAATACTPLTFQWYSNNAALTIFTNTTLALSNLTLSAAANYFVVASANGGATTSSVATLTVNLIPPAINSVTANANGSFNLNLTGSPGYIYILQATTNLLPPVNWLPLATNTLGTNGVWLFTDTSATNLPLQFYRLKLGP